MDLFVWPQRWYMASFDPDSLAVLAYVKFGSLPVNVRTDINIFQAPNGCVPYVVQGQNMAHGVNEIFEYFRKENYGIEYHLEGNDLVRLNALTRFVETELRPAVDHLFFVNSQNYSREVRSAYCESVSFPISLLLSSRLRKKADIRVRKPHLLNDRLSDEQLQRQVYDQAKVCLTTLSYLLGSENYFIGDKPTAIDALLFGLMLPLLKAPLPDNPLQQHLRQCDNLSRFCYRLQARYFAELPPTPSSNANNPAEGVLEPALSYNGVRNALLFSAFASITSLLFAFNYGLIEIHAPEPAEEAADNTLTITE